jgi:hypothetical protein
MGGIIKKIIKPIIKILPKFIQNPIVGIGVSLFLSWILRPKFLILKILELTNLMTLKEVY